MAGTEKIVVEIKPRSDKGKNACRRLRATGMLPGNVYGLDVAPFMVAVDPRVIESMLKLESGANTIFSLSLAGDQSQTRETMIKELQRDPVSERPLHVDFIRVDVSRIMQLKIPIRLEGLPAGVKDEGGILDFVHREVEVECLPGDIPEHLDVDVTGLHVNQHVSFGDLQVAAGVKILSDADQIIAVVVPPRVDEEEKPEGEEDEAAAGGVEGEADKKEGEDDAGSADQDKK